jgi:uncharacterized protein (DUF58 family)
VTALISSRLPAYAALAAVGLVAGLALGRVEPVALAAPFVLALVAAVAGRAPDVSVRLSLDRDRALEGDEVTATIELLSPAGVGRFELLVPPQRGLTVEEGAAQALVLRPGEERTLELTLRCDRWGNFTIGPLLVRARDPLGLRSWETTAGGGQPLRV